ncbi:guanylate kinase [Persicobacter psychrovividus]|uniref:Guanylate kinase n=1 Tax=Persicobacter psychrovividus TaxID=387638 RepID=A0ABM7VAV6_9BACT|nr:guanylate kinase [Persicobacter psychrovividus]
MTHQGKAFIFSAPSGSGKTTIVHHLLNQRRDLAFSISATTRAQRGQEVDGQDYYFLKMDDFCSRKDRDEFVEWEEVYPGCCYGTLKAEVERIWAEGKHVVFDVDVKGGVSLKKYFQERALAVFVRIPNLETLEARLRGRGTDDETAIKKRLAKAEYELGFEPDFDVTIINDRLDEALKASEKTIENFIRK